VYEQTSANALTLSAKCQFETTTTSWRRIFRSFFFNLPGQQSQPALNVAGGAFLRSPDGAFITFNPPGATFTVSQALNPAGVATGYFQDASGTHGFVRIP
jgi:hypothetical protein